MRYVLSLALVVVGIIHVLPLAGVLGVDRLQALYGVSLEDPNLVLLMRHRAVLFGILGVYCLTAAFVPTMQLTALVFGAISLVAFLSMAYMGGPLNAQIGRVVTADWIALVAVLVGAVALAMMRRAA